MGVLNILTDDFLVSLPDDDPQASFTMIVRRCESYLADELAKVDTSEHGSWHAYETEQYTAMRTMISAAQRLQIEPFKDLSVPTRKKFQSEGFDEFKHEVDHYLTQFVLDRTIREKRESVAIPTAVKDRLRTHIHAMRTYIDSADITDSKRARLHAKLSEFEASLEKDRIPIFKMARVLIEILSISANVVGLSESKTMARLAGTIIEVLGEAKAADDDSHRPLQIEHQQWIALPPKRREKNGQQESFSTNLDDEIPF